MKYRHIFSIWFLTNIIFSIGLLLYSIFDDYSKRGHLSGHMGLILVIFFAGLLISLPALVILLAAHYYFIKQISHIKYNLYYLFLIVVINVMYFLIGLSTHLDFKDACMFFGGTTLAGLAAFVIIDKKYKKEVLNDNR